MFVLTELIDPTLVPAWEVFTCLIVCHVLHLVKYVLNSLIFFIAVLKCDLTGLRALPEFALEVLCCVFIHMIRVIKLIIQVIMVLFGNIGENLSFMASVPLALAELTMDKCWEILALFLLERVLKFCLHRMIDWLEMSAVWDGFWMSLSLMSLMARFWRFGWGGLRGTSIGASPNLATYQPVGGWKMETIREKANNSRKPELLRS